MFRRMTEPARVVLCTCPDAIAGERLARALIDESLAACINMVPGLTSVYRWAGAVETAQETLLIIKTTASAYPTLEKRLAALHPYEVPEIVALDISAGLPAYLQWVESCVTA